MTHDALQAIRDKIGRADDALVRALAALPREISDPAWRKAAVSCEETKRRVRFGEKVAEVKWRLDRSRLEPLLVQSDRRALETAITDPEVEERVLSRVTERARLLGGAELAERVERFYRNWVIPETKRLQIERLLKQTKRFSFPSNGKPQESRTHADTGSSGS